MPARQKNVPASKAEGAKPRHDEKYYGKQVLREGVSAPDKEEENTPLWQTRRNHARHSESLAIYKPTKTDGLTSGIHSREITPRRRRIMSLQPTALHVTKVNIHSGAMKRFYHNIEWT